MAGKFHHEQLYRGQDFLPKLNAARVTICGVGALGSHLADTLARQGIGAFKVIDRDKVEEQNVGTQVYGVSDVGAWKVDILKNRLFNTVGIEIETSNKDLTERTARSLLKGGGVIVDTFDNSASRRRVQEHVRVLGLPCLHVGLFADYGEVIWDEHYRVPDDVGGDVCDYPLARNLVLLTVSVAAETIVRFLLTGSRSDWSITLKDLNIRPLEPAC